MNRFVHDDEHFMYGHPRLCVDHATKAFNPDTGCFLEQAGQDSRVSVQEGSTVDELLLEVGTWTNDCFISPLDFATWEVEHCENLGDN